MLLDEGMPIMKAGELALNPTFDLAMVGTAEKGAVSLQLSVEYSGTVCGVLDGKTFFSFL